MVSILPFILIDTCPVVNAGNFERAELEPGLLSRYGE